MISMHDILLAGYEGYFKTYREIKERFKGLKDDVLRHVRVCVTF
jgi:hypothetical protein